MTSTTPRIITIALAILALAAPAASAMPIRDTGVQTSSRAGTSSAPAQDLRNADNRVPAHLGADADRALAAEQYYSSYGDPHSTAPSQPQPTGNTEWPIIGLVGAGALLLALGSGTAIRKVRVRRRTAGAAA